MNVERLPTENRPVACYEALARLLLTREYSRVVALGPKFIQLATSSGDVHSEFALRLEVLHATALGRSDGHDLNEAAEQVLDMTRLATASRTHATGLLDAMLWNLRLVVCQFWTRIVGVHSVTEHCDCADLAEDVHRMRRSYVFVLLQLFCSLTPLRRLSLLILDPFHRVGFATWMVLLSAYLVAVPAVGRSRFGDWTSWMESLRYSTTGIWVLYLYLVGIGLVLTWPLITRPAVWLLQAQNRPEVQNAAARILDAPKTLCAYFAWVVHELDPAKTKKGMPVHAPNTEDAFAADALKATLFLLGPRGATEFKKLARVIGDWSSRL